METIENIKVTATVRTALSAPNWRKKSLGDLVLCYQLINEVPLVAELPPLLLTSALKYSVVSLSSVSTGCETIIIFEMLHRYQKEH